MHLLTNPAARAGRAMESIEAIVREIRARGHEVVVLRPENSGDAATVLSAALDDGARRIVVAGGDGTVHVAAGTIVASGHRDVVLGIVPVGTGNDLATGLGLPTKLHEAIERALGPASTIDVIDTGAAPILSVATVGFAVDVNVRANALRWPKGSMRYTLATFAVLPRLQPIPLRLTIDGTVHEVETTLLAVGNTARFGGGMQICPTASPSDGRLEVTIIGPVGRAELLRVFPRVFKGTHVTHKQVTTLAGETVKIETAQTGRELWGDGERVTTVPTTLRVRPGVLAIAGLRP